MQIQFKIEGVVELNRRLNGLANDIEDWTPATEKAGKYLTSFFSNEVFESEGAIISEKWPDGPYYHKLQRSGFMRNSFYFKNDKSQVEIGNRADYFKYHQSNKPRKKLPRRVMMKLDIARKRKVIKFFQEQIIALKRQNNL